MTIRVVIADDQGMVRSGFSVLLNAQSDIEVIAEAVNGQEAITHAAELHPDVILMDVRMPVLDGLQATRAITAMPDPIQRRDSSLTAYTQLRKSSTRAHFAGPTMRGRAWHCATPSSTNCMSALTPAKDRLRH